jgi:ABC-type branched-subunit amino acid transport system substrate-binding protein
MWSKSSLQSRRGLLWAGFAIIFLLLAGSAPAVKAQSPQNLEIAVALPLSGDGSSFGQPCLQGIQLAIEEANASGAGPRINLTTYDDQSSDEVAKEVAGQITASQAALVLGPAFSSASLAAGPVYAEAGLASLPPTATADAITQNPTTFRIIFKNSDQGETLATYLFRVLGQRRAAVIVLDSGVYGQSLRESFERTVEQLDIDAQYYVFKSEDDVAQIASQIAADPAPSPIVLLTLDPEGAQLLTALRRLGVTGPFLGADAFGEESFNQHLADLPEEQAEPGYFTDNLYGLTPVMLDSANADTLAFAERFRTRFGQDPTWSAVASYDAANLAVAAVRAVAANAGTNSDLKTQRAAVLNYLLSLNSPAKAQPGLLGPFWFDEARARPQAIRVGRFHGGRLESAPLQIVSVTTPDPVEIDSGAVFEMGPGRYARLQRVVYTGVFLNEIPRLDLTRASFNADFYLWLRFAHETGPGSADPTDLIFPNMISGSFNRERPAEQRQMADGTEYWLWRVQGEFRNDFDLRRFPFDQQALSLSFFNARAPMDRIVYVLDQRSAVDEPTGSSLASGPGEALAAGDTPGATLSIASPAAFRNLTQWDPLTTRSRRENLVTDSALGDPTRSGVESQRELSGFLVTVELERRALATLTKSLFPLVLLTLFLYAVLNFPATMLVPKAVITTLSMLSGVVLLTSVNSQLGSIGYTVAVEYIFYVFFGLAVLCIVCVFNAERMRVEKRMETALLIEHWSRIIFLVIVAVTLAGALWLYWNR